MRRALMNPGLSHTPCLPFPPCGTAIQTVYRCPVLSSAPQQIYLLLSNPPETTTNSLLSFLWLTAIHVLLTYTDACHGAKDKTWLILYGTRTKAATLGENQQGYDTNPSQYVADVREDWLEVNVMYSPCCVTHIEPVTEDIAWISTINVK